MYPLLHLHIICNDLENMLRFWQEALGAEFVARRSFGTAPGAVMRYGALQLNFKEVPASAGARNGMSCYDHMAFGVDNLEEATERLITQFGCSWDAAGSAGKRTTFLRGPEGLLIELTEMS